MGLHRLKVLEMKSGRLNVGPIEAIEGTPVIDIKPVIETNGLLTVQTIQEGIDCSQRQPKKSAKTESQAIKDPCENQTPNCAHRRPCNRIISIIRSGKGTSHGTPDILSYDTGRWALHLL
jgi:hypothetical protein